MRKRKTVNVRKDSARVGAYQDARGALEVCRRRERKLLRSQHMRDALKRNAIPSRSRMSPLQSTSRPRRSSLRSCQRGAAP